MEDMEQISHLMLKLYQTIVENKLTDKINIKTTIYSFFFAIFVPLLILELIQNIPDGDFVVDVIFDLFIVTCSFVNTFIICSLKKENIYKLIDVLSKDLFIYCTPLSQEQLEIKRKAMKDAKLVLTIYLFVVAVALSTKLLPSLFFLLQKLPEGIKDGEKVHFPLHCYIPTFVDTVFEYLIAYCFMVILLLITVAVYIVEAILFPVSIIYARKEIKLLVVSLKELDERSECLQKLVKMYYIRKRTSINITSSLENYVLICTRDVIQHHNEIISLVDLLNDIFGFLLFTLAQIICLILSLSAHRLSDVTISLECDFVNYLGVGLSGFLTFWMYSWLGQSLIDEDVKLRQALYSCTWLNKSTKFRKTLMIMMERTKRPLCIRIGKIYILNFNTFSKMMNAAYSYFNLLRTVRLKKTY